MNGEAGIAEPPSLVDRLGPSLVHVLTLLGFGIPVIGYFWIISHYGVDVIIDDQLSNIPLIHASYSHPFPWGALWTPHTDNRMFFPNLIVILLAHTDNFNTKTEEFLGASMLVLATMLLCWSHKRRSRSTPWLYYCPVAFLTLSLVQYESTLWGFQMAWYLLLLSITASLTLLDRIRLSWLTLLGAILAAVVASFSSLQGLLIWPIGLILLYHRRRNVSTFIAWIVAGCTTAFFYYRNLSASGTGPTPRYAVLHPTASLRFFLTAVGDVLGNPIRGSGSDAVSLLFGIAIMALAVYSIAAYGVRRDEESASPFGIALIGYGVLFAAAITQGRIGFGEAGASASRYTTFDLLILVGIYLTLLGPPNLSTSNRVGTRRQNDEAKAEPHEERYVIGRTRWAFTKALPIARWSTLCLILLQVLLGFENGITGIRGSHERQVQAVEVLQNLNHNLDYVVASVVDPWKTATYIREQARTAESLHLSLFANSKTGNAGSSTSLPPPSVGVVIPRAGSKVKGTQVLDAFTSTSIGVESVEFRIATDSHSYDIIVPSKPTTYGWIGQWNSVAVPNGRYAVQGIATTFGGRTSVSAVVRFQIAN
ncbi:MAG: hypothetical protein ACLPR9_10275 [Acidimicrobiales bacterium]